MDEGTRPFNRADYGVRSVDYREKPEIEPRAEAWIELAPLDEIEKAERPVEIVQITRPSLVSRSGFREEIQGRVAAFRAHQQLFHRERDAYFNSVLTKARASIDSAPKAPGD